MLAGERDQGAFTGEGKRVARWGRDGTALTGWDDGGSMGEGAPLTGGDDGAGSAMVDGALSTGMGDNGATTGEGTTEAQWWTGRHSVRPGGQGPPNYV